ncbi:hypothetical protein PHPALM_31168 [Phytophthora palmivora]|uniref:Uncharacterized protein n=1 Tax=Phytophthora palmivora TaxID=4796 RepID=A0A2P4X394_9STRA|nr:hypothetical protein PHPALM_31168 [Phytophthora palmivora]
MSTRLLLDIAIALIEDSQHPTYNNAFRQDVLQILVTRRRIQDFTDRFNIVYRRLKGKKQISNEKKREIHSSVGTHLGELKRLFDDNLIDPSRLCNMEESHFVIDLDDGRTLDFRGVKHVKCCSIVSGTDVFNLPWGQEFTKNLGGANSRIICPMLIFRNKNSNYPIQGLPDNINGVAYRSSPTAFINNSIMQ